MQVKQASNQASVASFKLHDFANGIDWKVSFAADNFANQLQTGSAYDATSLTKK